jgi:site-specific DNA recombinase
MRAAVYARVSTTRQAQAQTIEQQLDRLRAAVAEHGWELDQQHVYRDDGYSGASLGRPGLDRLRDHAALADLDVVLVTAPDRLARNYVHQVLLIEELAGHGCRVEFLDRPMSADPHDQLLLQIRGAVAEYERTLIAERMRRGRLAKLRAGTLLPWTRAPFGYRLDAERPRDPAAVRVEPGEAVLVAQLFDWYLEPQATVYQLARRLTGLGVATPMGKPCWNVASVRGILRNPAYAGRALTNRTRVTPARRRKSAMLPAGAGVSHAPRPPEDWIEVPVPQIVSEETFAQVQAKLDANQQGAARNTRHEYLLRALVSCGVCRLSCTARRSAAGYCYYLCRGRTDPLRAAQGQRCTARYIPAGQLDELVWADLCALLTDPAHVTRALARARGGAWLPQELQARQAAIRRALGQLDRQRQRLLDAYLAQVIGLDELQRKRQELDRRHATLLAQQRQLEAAAGQRLELQAVADGIERFCHTVRAGLATATFAQRRQLAELLIDRVIVTNSEVEIRYVLPTSPDGPRRPFCQLRKDHLDRPARPGHPDQLLIRGSRRGAAQVVGQLMLALGVARQRAAGQQPPRPARRGGVLRAGQGGSRPVEDPGALGALAAAAALPRLLRCVRGEHVGAGGTGAAGNDLVAGHGDDIADSPLLQPGPELDVLAVRLIGGHPGGGDAGVQRPGQHLPGQVRLGGEHCFIGHRCLAAAVLVTDPRFRQVQLPVDQGPAPAGDVGAEHAQLAVLHPARGAGVLPLHPGRLGALLQEPGLIDHQHAIGGAEVPGHVAAHIVSDAVGVPGRGVQQPLHPIRRRITGRLGQGPPVLAGQRR